ncbi:PAS domain S-box protein [Roseomonas sp. M0104]|uniref:histidine kinase n=1 Tax=Teichococcus coralli TaxID=2545983 RepID=A0A845BP22_9PROT|nr:PAS domain S-box protein [Pseudoroseomonas coralli]MXP65149.1 PAS domain S-box protein [Pseudoroseomonas coralli]
MSGQAIQQPPSVRLYLLLIALAALLPVWGLAGHLAGRMAETERNRLLETASDAARDLAFNLEREVLGLRGELVALGTSPALRAGQFAAFHEQAHALRAVRHTYDIRLTDTEGHVLVDSATPFHDPAVPLPDLPLLTHAPQKAGISTLYVPEHPREKLRIDITEEIPRSAGLPPLLLSASLDPATIWDEPLRNLGLPSGWTALVADDSARILARRPAVAQLIGTQGAAGGAIRTALDSQQASGSAAKHDFRGVPVHAAWHRVEGTPWLVLVALPTEMLDGALRRMLSPVVLLGGGLLLVFTAGLAFWVDRKVAVPLNELGRIAGAFGRGAPLPRMPRSGLREIDVATQALAAAVTEREALEAERLTLSARLQTVLESTTDSVLVLDRAGKVLYLNGRARAQAVDAAGSIGRPLQDSFPGWDGGPFGAACEQALTDGAPKSVTAFHPALGRWISADVYPSAEELTLFFRDVSDERAAQAALRQSEARLKAVLDNVPVGVILAEAPAGRILLGNRRLDEILRYPLELAAGMDEYAVLWEAYHADGRRVEGPDFSLSRALLTGLPCSAEFRYRRGDGSMVWLRSTGMPVRDAEGRVVGAVVALADIDAERRAAEALRESELRFRTLAEAVPQVVWSSLPDGRIDYVNPRLRDFTGLVPGLAMESLARIIHPEDQQRAERAWQRALRRGQPFSTELRLLRAEGGWRWCAVRALPARAADGTIRRWIGAATDVSELVEAREALARQVAAQTASREAAVQAAAALAASESRFRRFAEASPDVMWMTDPAANRVEFVSPAFERIWGVAQERFAVQPDLWLEMIHPADRPRLEVVRKGRQGAETFEVEYRIQRPDGTQRWIRDVSFPILDTQGLPSRRGGLARDVTDAKASEARQALLLGELNHRVKNTLATVHSLALQTARTMGDKPEATQRFLQDFQSRLLTLARGHDLLTARTWRGTTLAETARAVLTPWQSTSGPEGESRLVVSGPPVWLAPKQTLGLALALHELATNAVKHGALTRAEGRILVRWEGESDGMVQLTWQEQNGPPVRAPARSGFGTRMLQRGLPAELGPGSSVGLDYAADGFVAVVRFRPVNGPQVEEETA